MRVHFIVPVPENTQSTRFRVVQYLPYLELHGVKATISSFQTRSLNEIIYKPGHLPQKVTGFFVGVTRRVADVYRVWRSDVVFVLREACPLGPPVFERIYRVVNPRMIFDFDDAIFIRQVSEANRFVRFLKRPEKTREICKMSKKVICAIPFLGEYAKKHNPNIVIIWTPIDDELYQPVEKDKGPDDPIVVGWIGSKTTQVFPKALRNVYRRLAEKYPKVVFKFVDMDDFEVEGVDIRLKEFLKEEEVEDLQSFDIGIYPLCDIEYAHGKCGFKTQQYMGVGVPTVSTPIGGVTHFVTDGVNGFLASNEDEWVDRLSRLIEDRTLRAKMGAAGRETVEKNLSVRALAPKLLEAIREVAEMK